LLDRLRELTGIYSLGFNKESVIGLLLPIGFVVVAILAFGTVYLTGR